MWVSARELLVLFFLHLWYGAAGIQTHDLSLQKQTLSQLSYQGGQILNKQQTAHETSTVVLPK